jgi:anti-sigma regulatory factor (Ser/Thr protein kinase)
VAAETRCFSSDIAGLRLISDWIRTYFAETHVPKELVDRVDLCLHESVDNVMLHGYDTETSGSVTISLEEIGDGFRATVADHGRSFNPLEHPIVPLAANLEDARAGGFGIHLVRSFADTVEYRREGDRNILAMSFCARCC